MFFSFICFWVLKKEGKTILTNNKFNVDRFFCQMWKVTGVVSIVADRGVSDYNRGVTKLQLLLKMWDPSFELLVLTFKVVVVMKASIIHKHLLFILILSPVKQLLFKTLLGGDGAGQECVTSFWYNHCDDFWPWGRSGFISVFKQGTEQITYMAPKLPRIPSLPPTLLFKCILILNSWISVFLLKSTSWGT